MDRRNSRGSVVNKKGVRWFYGELPELVSEGVLSAESAERLRHYYGDIEGKGGRRIALTVCSILGALLIGLGIILLLAHNWEDLSRSVRTILSMSPLIVAQLLAGWAILYKKESIAWREGISTFYTLAVGASIALVGQTYHISSDMANFLLTWMLLIVPLIYLMRATFPAILYLIGITAWAGYAQHQVEHAVLFWPMFALIIPHFLQAVRGNLYGIRSIILAWAISLCLCVAIGITLEKVLPGFWIVVYSSFFAVLYLIGGFWFGDAPTVWQRPFHSVGALGVFWLSFLLTFKWPWNEIGWRYHRYGEGYYEIAAIPEYFFTAVLLMVAVFLLVTSVRRGHAAKLLFGVVPILAIIGYSLSGFEGISVIERGIGFSTLLFNLYVLVLGVGTISVGIRKEHMGIVNAGMLMLIILIAARFFDSNMGFVVRGVAFIILGIGFLTTNLLLVRRRGTVK